MSKSRASYFFVGSVAATLLLFWTLVRSLVQVASASECSYIPLIPFISGFLLVVRRPRIFAQSKPSPQTGATVVALGLVLLISSRLFHFSTLTVPTAVGAVSLVITWIGLFILYYGVHTARTAMLPLFLLFFMVPLPGRLMGAAISFLQHGSAVLSYYLFRVLGVAALRDGTTISLPRVEIDVAPQCSGIRSSLSLLILVLAAANLYLRSGWNKVVLVLVVVPLMVLKNAIRIVTLCTLALYVNRGFLSGNLHRDGGIFFFLIAVAMFIPILKFMRRREGMHVTQ